MEQKISISNKIYDDFKKIVQNNVFELTEKISSNIYMVFEIQPQSSTTIPFENITHISVLAQNTEDINAFGTVLIKFDENDLVELCRGSFFNTQNLNGIQQIYVENVDTVPIKVSLMVTNK